MADSITAAHTFWDCRWSRPADPPRGSSEQADGDGAWVCMRDGVRRYVSADDCRRCARWELAFAAQPLTLRPSTPARVADEVAATQPLRSGEFPRVAAQAIFIATALCIFAIGFTLLTSPLWVPVTIAIWLSAAAIVAYAILGIPANASESSPE